MQLDYLQAYCAVYEMGSFAKAARKLAISTPMMTRRIQQVEAILGVKLLHRTTRALIATEAGEMFYQEALEIVKQYNSSLAALKTLDDNISGTIKIGVPTSISNLWVAPTLHKLNEKYPDLSVRIVTGNHLLDLLSDRFDLVIHCSVLPDSGFYFQKIRSWHKITCASPSYIKKNGAPQNPYELNEYNCIDHFDNSNSTWGFKINKVRENIFIQGNMQANSSMDLKSLALSGLGMVYLPSFIVAEDLAQGRLQEVLVDYRLDPYAMYVVYPHKKQHNKRLQAVIDYLDDILP